MPLSPYRCSDGRHSSYLLRAVAQLRSQLRAHLLRAPPAPSQRPSAWRWVGGILLGPVLLSKCPRLCLVALCEAEEAPPACSRPCVGDSRFNWKLFWQFLRPHLLVLAAAIVVRCPSPFAHTRDREGPSQGFAEAPAGAAQGQLVRLTKSQDRPQEAARAGCLRDWKPRDARRSRTGQLGVQGTGIPRLWQPGLELEEAHS